MDESTIPEGYMMDSFSRLVPKSMINEVDLVRNELVLEIVGKTKELQTLMTRAKMEMMADIGAFIELSAEKYGAKVGGEKGNVSLVSYNGKYKVVRSMQDVMVFDERLSAAKVLVDECIHEWAKGSNDNIKALIEHAFQVDKQGNVSVSRIFGLLRLSINDVKWLEAMKALRESMQVVASKSYVNVYERDKPDDKYKAISLNFASL